MAPTATSTSPMLTPTFTKLPTCKWIQHHLKNQVAEIQGPKRTVNLDFSFLRNSSLATSTPRDIKEDPSTCPCIENESKEEAGLLSKPLKSQSPPRMLQTCLKRLKKTWQDFGNGFTDGTICHVHVATCLEASCGAGFSAGTSMCWSSFKLPPKCDWRI